MVHFSSQRNKQGLQNTALEHASTETQQNNTKTRRLAKEEQGTHKKPPLLSNHNIMDVRNEEIINSNNYNTASSRNNE